MHGTADGIRVSTGMLPAPLTCIVDDGSCRVAMQDVILSHSCASPRGAQEVKRLHTITVIWRVVASTAPRVRVWHQYQAPVAVGDLTTRCETSGSSRQSCSPRTPPMGSWPRGERSGPFLERLTDVTELILTVIHVADLCSGLGSRGADSGAHGDAYKP